MLVRCYVLLAAVAFTCFLTTVDSVLPNTYAGFVTDIETNPIGVLVCLALKKLLLFKLGLLAFGKRSIDQSIHPSPSPVRPDGFEQLATSLDSNGCVAKLICEIVATKDKPATTNFERAILKIYGEDRVSDLTPMTGFQFAAKIGKISKSPADCSAAFSKCQRDTSEIKTLADNVFDSKLLD